MKSADRPSRDMPSVISPSALLQICQSFELHDLGRFARAGLSLNPAVNGFPV